MAASEQPSTRLRVFPLAYRLNDAAMMLGVSRSAINALVRDGRLQAKQIGRAVVVTHDSLEAFFEVAAWSEATKRAMAAQAEANPPKRGTSLGAVLKSLDRPR